MCHKNFVWCSSYSDDSKLLIFPREFVVSYWLDVLNIAIVREPTKKLDLMYFIVLRLGGTEELSRVEPETLFLAEPKQAFLLKAGPSGQVLDKPLEFSGKKPAQQPERLAKTKVADPVRSKPGTIQSSRQKLSSVLEMVHMPVERENPIFTLPEEFPISPPGGHDRSGSSGGPLRSNFGGSTERKSGLFMLFEMPETQEVARPLEFERIHDADSESSQEQPSIGNNIIDELPFAPN